MSGQHTSAAEPARPSSLRDARNASAIVGAVAFAAACLWGWRQPDAFFRAYLVSWMYFVGIAVGSLFMLLVRELVGGDWGVALRRPLLAATTTLPLLFVLAVPLAFGLPELFSWARGHGGDALDAQRWYLNRDGFIAREAVLLGIWCALALVFRSLVVLPDDDRRRRWLRPLAAAGIVVHAVVVTAFAYDWVSSLLPQWRSTAIGVRVGAGQALGGIAFGVSSLLPLARLSPGSPRASPKLCGDFGNLLLTVAMFLGYIAYMQYLIIWSADLPHEIAWYLPRLHGSWTTLTVAVLALEILLPVTAMLFRAVKRNLRALTGVCLVVLAARWLDSYWLVMPSLLPAGVDFHLLDVLALLALGGLWLAGFAWSLTTRVPAGAELFEQAAVRG